MEVRDLTEGPRADKSKSDTTHVSWMITTVWNRRVKSYGVDGTEYVADYDQYKAYARERLKYFFDNRFMETLGTSTMDPKRCKFKMSASLEISERYGFLHAHVVVNAEFPREKDPDDPKGRLKRPLISYADFGRVFRETVDMGSVKTMIKIIGFSNAYEKVKAYMEKHA